MKKDKDLQIKELEELNNVLSKKIEDLNILIYSLRSEIRYLNGTILDLKDRMYDGID